MRPKNLLTSLSVKLFVFLSVFFELNRYLLTRLKTIMDDYTNCASSSGSLQN